MVDPKGFEPSTSRMRTERSPDGDGKQTLVPEFTFFVHITGYKMNSKAIKLIFVLNIRQFDEKTQLSILKNLRKNQRKIGIFW